MSNPSTSMNGEGEGGGGLSLPARLPREDEVEVGENSNLVLNGGGGGGPRPPPSPKRQEFDTSLGLGSPGRVPPAAAPAPSPLPSPRVNPPSGMTVNYNQRNPAVRRLMQECAEMSSSEEKHDVHAAPLEDNLFEWHFTMRGPSDTVFSQGIYHGRIILPSNYPMTPPEIAIFTPNGRFETGIKICLSISNHHPETWLPSWGIRTAVTALRAFMATDSAGAIGAMQCSEAVRKQLATDSAKFCCPSCGPTIQLLKPLPEPPAPESVDSSPEKDLIVPNNTPNLSPRLPLIDLSSLGMATNSQNLDNSTVRPATPPRRVPPIPAPRRRILEASPPLGPGPARSRSPRPRRLGGSPRSSLDPNGSSSSEMESEDDEQTQIHEGFQGFQPTELLLNPEIQNAIVDDLVGPRQFHRRRRGRIGRSEHGGQEAGGHGDVDVLQLPNKDDGPCPGDLDYLETLAQKAQADRRNRICMDWFMVILAVVALLLFIRILWFRWIPGLTGFNAK